MINWIPTSEEDELTILEFLQRRMPAAPGGYLRQLLRAGKIIRDGRPLSSADLVHRGDRLILPASRRLHQLIETAPGLQTPILFESREILAVCKPAGLAVHRGEGHEEDNLVKRVNGLMKARKAPFRTAPAHRLDVETSGPVLFGKGRQATARLGKLFMADAVGKTYLALVEGEPGERGELMGPVPVRGKLKEARTRYRTLTGGHGYSLIELSPRSGRTHQIRRQLATAGHPLAGDRRYAGPQFPALARLFLHCRRLALTDPFQDIPLEIDVPLPPELTLVLERLGLLPNTKADADR